MTGIPTVVYGFVGVFLLTPVLRRLFDHGSGLCVLGASVMLAVLVAPTMILFMADGFARVPKSYLDAADALGATPVQRFLFVVVPAGRGGIVTGGLLGLARAFGDTLIALMLAGNAAAVPHSPLDPARTLTSHIALVQAADVDSLEFRSIFVCGLVLYLLTTVLIMTVRRVGATSLGAP
jgi:phosphate transport system permease protein